MKSMKVVPASIGTVAQKLHPLFRSIFSGMCKNTTNIYDFRKHPNWKEYIREAKEQKVALIYICQNPNTAIGWLPAYEYKEHGKSSSVLPPGSVITSFIDVKKELHR